MSRLSLRLRSVAAAMLGIDRATDSPNRAGLSLDPDHDTFSDTRIIDPFEHALGEDRARLSALHDSDPSVT